MPRKPTPADYKRLRALLNAAGSRDALNSWIDAALRGEDKRRAGRKNYGETLTVGTITRVCEAEGRARTALIRQLVLDNPRLRGTGTEKSAIERIKRKLTMLANHLEKYPAEWDAAFSKIANLIRGTD